MFVLFSFVFPYHKPCSCGTSSMKLAQDQSSLRKSLETIAKKNTMHFVLAEVDLC